MLINNRIAQALSKPLKNKNGFSFIEAIAVVAIMSVLAVVIGGLLSSGTTAYIRQKEAASAKDLSAIIEKEIARKMLTATSVYLVNGSLPTGERIAIDDIHYNFDDDSVPFKESNDIASAFYVSENGLLMFRDNDSDGDGESYFTETPAEKTAFYGSYTVVLKFGAVENGSGIFNALIIYADVYKGDKLMFDSPGRIVTFLASMNPGGADGIVHAVANSSDAFKIKEKKSETEYDVAYKDLLLTNGGLTFTHAYFI